MVDDELLACDAFQGGFDFLIDCIQLRQIVGRILFVQFLVVGIKGAHFPGDRLHHHFYALGRKPDVRIPPAGFERPVRIDGRDFLGQRDDFHIARVRQDIGFLGRHPDREVEFGVAERFHLLGGRFIVAGIAAGRNQCHDIHRVAADCFHKCPFRHDRYRHDRFLRL